MHNQPYVDQFVNELVAIGLSPVQNEDALIVAYTFEKELQDKFNKIRDHYVQFWKSFGMKVDHNRETNASRYEIPLHLIDPQDFSANQVDAIIDATSKSLSGMPR